MPDAARTSERGAPSLRLLRPAAAAALLIGVLHYALVGGFTIDDAAISFSYARSIADGTGFGFLRPGDFRGEGYSNFLWTLLLAGGARLGLEPLVAAKILGLGFLVACVLLLQALVARVARRRALQWAVVLLPASLTFVLWCASGLENALFGAAVLAAVVSLIDEERTGAVPWRSALSLLAVSLTRPEGFIYAAAAALEKLAGVLDGRSSGAARPRLRNLAAFTLLFLGGEALYLAWHLHLFAWAFPNPVYAKTSVPVAHLLRSAIDPRSAGWLYVRQYFIDEGALGLLLPTLMGLVAARRPPVRPVLLMLLASLALPLARPDWMVHYRFMFLFVPLSLALGAAGVDAFLDLAEARRWPARALRAGAVALGLFAGGFVLVNGLNAFGARQSGFQHGDTMEQIVDNYRPLARWAQIAGLRDPLYLLLDQGGTNYRMRLRTVDGVGLTDTQVAHSGFRRDVLEEYLFVERRPELIQVSSPWTEIVGFDRMPLVRRDYLLIERSEFRGDPVHGSGSVVRLIRRDALVTGRKGERRFELAPGLWISSLEGPRVARPGGELALDAYVWAERPLGTDVFLRVRLLGADGRARFARAWPLGYGILPTSRWPEGAVLRQHLSIPVQEPGDFTLELSAGDERGAPVSEARFREAMTVSDESARGFVESQRKAAASSMSAGRPEEAVEALSQAAEVEPQAAELAAELDAARRSAADASIEAASAALERGELEESLRQLETSARLAPSRCGAAARALSASAARRSEAVGDLRQRYLLARLAALSDPCDGPSGRRWSEARRAWVLSRESPSNAVRGPHAD